VKSYVSNIQSLTDPELRRNFTALRYRSPLEVVQKNIYRPKGNAFKWILINHP
jgi:hypothetical protein